MRAELEQELSHTLLLELLAYQFASPVRWIETQDFMFKNPQLERLVEIGPSPTLSQMAIKTLQSKFREFDAAKGVQRQVLCYAKNQKEIHYLVEEETFEAEPPHSTQQSATQAAFSVPVPTPTPASVPAASPSPANAAVQVDDKPVSAAEILFALVAQKLKKPLDEISPQKSIKDLVGGKSTLQNEILGDLQREFGLTPEKPEEIPLDELAASLQPTFSGNLGKFSTSLISRLISAKMPGGFSQSAVRTHIKQKWGLDSGRQDSTLLIGLTMEPSSRFSGEPEAKAWIDSIVQKYAAKNGLSLQTASAQGTSGSSSGASIDEATFKKLTSNQTMLVTQQLELFARYLNQDLRAGQKLYIAEKDVTAVLQSQLDLWLAEHGDFYASGISPAFDRLKARVYDSEWNWVRQDAILMYYDIIFGKLTLVDREIVAQCISIMNRANPVLVDFMQYHIDHCPTERGERYTLAKEYASRLLENCIDALDSKPHYKDVQYPMAPKTTLTARGDLSYAEVRRADAHKLELYVAQMAKGGEISQYVSKDKIQKDLSKLYKAIMTQGNRLSAHSRDRIKFLYSEIARTVASESIMANGANNGNISSPNSDVPKKSKMRYKTIPFLHLMQKTLQSWEYSRNNTETYLNALEKGAREGISFSDRYALMTGCGQGSIGADVLQGLLAGGAKVVVTTSRYSKRTTEFYQSLYARHGSKGSCLIVVPFNQGSKQDVDALIEYIYDEKNGLGWDLDFVVPFAAIPENGREIDSIDSRSELAHRIMLTNLLRMLGNIKMQKASRKYDTRPAQVMLPLSPNHGTFGSDGLYSESKLALETLYNRWHSESWSQYLTICGTVIGWTRGTGLMGQNNIIADGIESYGVRTFSQKEMAFNILGLMSPDIINLCQKSPINANLNGGLEFLPDLKSLTSKLRTELMETAEVRRAVAAESALDFTLVNGPQAESRFKKAVIKPRANLKFNFPTTKAPDELRDLSYLKEVIDLQNVVVVTGFSEVGPWGNSRTRWEMEAYGEFSLEGCIEMAWIMGFIKHHNGPLKNGKFYSGWIDTKTGETVDDLEVKKKYEEQILKHSGIRFIEAELFNGYNPDKKELIQEVQIDHDLEPFEASKETALEFKRHHGDKVEVFEDKETGEWTVRFKKGATILVPKALKFNRLVAGQIPTGWDPKRYGISDDIISQVDPGTLFVLVSVAEALVSSGITDPYEFYKYVHVSEVGNCIGSGVGGMSALRGMYKDRWLDKPLQKDILQESFINTASAWVNMLILSASGPIKTPVGACATAIESIDIAVDTILSGKARIVIAGGYDDFSEEGSYEFANMGATSNSVDELARGREPKEMSRPATTTRSGFMEAQGAGVSVLMQAKLALEMGVPIYGIVAFSSMAMDKEGRSVPAPGKGILTGAREVTSKYPSPLLDIKYRARQLRLAKQRVTEWAEREYLSLEDEIRTAVEQDSNIDANELRASRVEYIKSETNRQISVAEASYGSQFWRNNPTIAPIKGALAVWGLTVDDIGAASFHGTSTVANEKNESEVISRQLEHLGRSKGNPVLGVFQKYLTGHPKGGAASWMLNGALQILETGVVPGNRNADNIDINLAKYDKIVFPSRSIRTDGIKAVSVTSFGFGQVGGQAIVVHPDYLFAALDPHDYERYRQHTSERYHESYSYMHSSMVNNSLFIAKTSPPYTVEQECSIYLDPLARVSPDAETGSFEFISSKMPASQLLPTKQSSTRRPSSRQTPQNVASGYVSGDESEKRGMEQVIEALTATSLATSGEGISVGVDVEVISSLNIANRSFVERNFTDAEQQYCDRASSPAASYAGTWSAKEAVFKALNTASQGGGASLRDIEIVRNANGAPTVQLHGAPQAAAKEQKISDIQVSISHDDIQSVSVAVASRK